MPIELKKCPFCNSESIDVATSFTYYNGISDAYVYCGDCGCEGPHVEDALLNDFESMEEYNNAMMEEAVNLWNKRGWTMVYNDQFGYHEVIHTTHVMLCMWEDHILGHGVVEEDTELTELADRISSMIGDFYQLVSKKSDEKFNK